ncbi:MAG: hypothetical protein BWY07_00232 [Candidatus Hydrogenedentes bacterium ADurb.Bin170]|nr:MAG: hypothetical protein BWY07_00232 [Candidatus Hydrogenedentes bacterium ADurb.Bin170]
MPCADAGKTELAVTGCGFCPLRSFQPAQGNSGKRQIDAIQSLSSVIDNSTENLMIPLFCTIECQHHIREVAVPVRMNRKTERTDLVRLFLCEDLVFAPRKFIDHKLAVSVTTCVPERLRSFKIAEESGIGGKTSYLCTRERFPLAVDDGSIHIASCKKEYIHPHITLRFSQNNRIAQLRGKLIAAGMYMPFFVEGNACQLIITVCSALTCDRWGFLCDLA